MADLLLSPDAPAFSWLLPSGSQPPEHDWQDGLLTIRGGAATDWFIDPGGAPPVSTAPLLLAPAAGPVLLAATLRPRAESTFDAAALFVFEGSSVWAKLAVERSPAGEVMVVTVITDRVSDDANHLVLPSGSARLRVAALGGGTYAFHVRLGTVWQLVRYFRLPHANPRIGFSAQSPTGQGCTATFGDISWTVGRLDGLRDGS